MPNWCCGTLKVRGEKINVVKFLKESLQTIPNKKEYEFNEEKDLFVGGPFYLSPTERGFVDAIEALFGAFSDENMMTIKLFYRQAWDIKTEELLELCQKYNVDMRIYASEPNMCFDLDILIEDGEIVKNDTLEFDDHEFESPLS